VQSHINDLKIRVYGHESAEPAAVALAFGGSVAQDNESDSDIAIFAVNPSAGVDQQTIDSWQALDQYQLPRLVVVTHLEALEADFDDAVMICNRVFDQMLTPFLVLHDEDGLPTALISLENLSIINYTQSQPIIEESQPEHKTLVQEFRAEYFEQVEAAGEDAFAAGLLFPAIPLWIEKGIGVDIVQKYIEQIA